jgi:hypothetical protein
MSMELSLFLLQFEYMFNKQTKKVFLFLIISLIKIFIFEQWYQFGCRRIVVIIRDVVLFFLIAIIYYLHSLSRNKQFFLLANLFTLFSFQRSSLFKCELKRTKIM